MHMPTHIGIIPDGNRRWAQNAGFDKHEGYDYGLDPGVTLLRLARSCGIKELTFYGFTTDNCKRPKVQVQAFQKACIDAVEKIADENVSLLVVGNTDSPMFPKELLPYTNPKNLKEDKIRVNFLVNYGWEWDLSCIEPSINSRKQITNDLHSSAISRIDLIIRWGGRKRLSGFLPVQSVYADIYTIDALWPEFTPEHFFEALEWYNEQDITLGG